MAGVDKPQSRREQYRPRFDRRLTLSRPLFPLSAVERDDEGFELHFMEELLDRDPCNEDCLMRLGYVYTRRGEYAKGLVMDERLARLRPEDPTAFYNLACSHALLGHSESAFAALDRAILLGYRDIRQMMSDPDLESLRKEPRFRKLVARLFDRSGKES